MAIRSLSVVVPVFNGTRFLERAVASILEQSAPPAQLEIWLVNDGSTDDSDALCRQLERRHPAIRYVALPANGGVACARNEGVRRANHEYLGFLDQDDVWDAGKLAVQGEAFESRPEAGYVLGKMDFFLDGLDSYPRWFKPKWAEAPQPGYVLSAMLIRAARFREIGPLDEKYRFGDDVDWFARARASDSIEIMLPETVLHRRVHADNASARTEPSNRELLQIIKAKLERRP
ncbi:putative glycosyltransferase EpsJ [Pigmentiphaga humi]|uniref:Putative glycosyltransferase EpsJ n=1 Tax=Pigmentiphaga humi TaxID=2478468 RepID=A0A3P4B6G7_9BURK|nr:glycosyltransferase family A protein [Pigmentiphaga humi]VCU71116.1 putative glycosyltransferase EpsJ [Pigmentiphaga humi]